MQDALFDRLQNCDTEDICDVFLKIEKSLGFKFGKNELEHTKTFGQFCDIISNKLPQADVQDCTTQQVLYKLRESILTFVQVEKMAISPSSRLEDLFPRKGRRRMISGVKKQLELPLNILRPRRWITISLVILILASIIEVFINWRHGLSCLAIATATWKVADFFAKEFMLKTVGEVAHELVTKNYLKARRNPDTINHREVETLVKRIFSDHLLIDPKALTRDALFAG